MEYSSYLFLPVPCIAALVWAFHFWGIWKKPQITVPRRYIGRAPFFARMLFFILGLGGWFLLSISILGPRTIAGRTQGPIEANDIFFVVDVSRSMEAIDFPPNRMEVAKMAIVDFVRMMPRDRMGVIIFSEKAFSLLPLTTDGRLITRTVQTIKTRFLGNGTNIGDALGLAIGRLAISLAKNKVIILLTDGVSNVGSMTPGEAAEEAKKQKVKIYTIAVGGKQEALLPVGGGRYEKIPGGSVDYEGLEKIAEITNARSYRSTDPESLKKTFATIEKLEKSKIDVKSSVIYKEEYLRFLFWGALIIFLVELFKRFFLRVSI